jgi:Tfp pilus assembly protein PilN
VLIEINLAPKGSTARLAGRRMPKLGLPAVPALGGDVRSIGGVVAVVLVLALLVFGFLRMGTREAQLEARIEEAVEDSTRYASTIELLNSLQARQDTIARKIEVIRSVDTRRYVWPHLMDEISLAVPAYAWMTEITSTESEDSLQVAPSFTIQGAAGSTQALTRFMTNLEASPFITDVSLITTEQEVLEGRPIQRFSLEALYRDPDPSMIQTVPLVAVE